VITIHKHLSTWYRLR